jgi:hypothetical protein
MSRRSAVQGSAEEPEVDPHLRAALQSRIENGEFAARFRSLLQEVMTGQKANGQPIGDGMSTRARRAKVQRASGGKRGSGAKRLSATRRNKTGRKGRGNMYGSVPAPPDITADDFVPGGEYDLPNTLVSRVRQLVEERAPDADANALVRLGTPQNLSYMHHDGAASFMASVWNDCPFCSGAQESLRDLALAMHEHNKRIKDPESENRYALIIYDTKRHGNRGYAQHKLGVDAVPAFHLVVPVGENLDAKSWSSPNVKTERGSDGRIKKTLPIREIMSALSEYDKQSAGQQRKIEKYRSDAARQR